MSEELARREPWNRQPHESAAAFQNFTAYRDCPPPRSIAKAARICGKAKVTLEQQSVRHGWVARCDAFDLHQDRQRQRAREEAIAASEELELRAAQHATAAALSRLAGRGGGIGADGRPLAPVEKLDPNTLDAHAAVALMREGFRQRRLLHGQATDLSKSLDTFSLREVSEIVTEVIETLIVDVPKDKQAYAIARVRQIGLNRPR